MALNDEHRDLLQANLKRISANFMDQINDNGGASSSHRASKMMMRNQMSFGKRDRQDNPPGASLDDSGFRSDLVMRGAPDGGMMLLNEYNHQMMMGEEFSDESLFGEDNIEKLIEKKNNSFIRGSNALGENSFKSKGGKMRNQQDDSQMSPTGSEQKLGKQ